MELPINPETGNRMLVIRQSDFKLWLVNRRDFYLGVVRNLEPVQQKVGVADVGTFVHHGMQAHYLGTMDPIAAIAAAANEAINANPFGGKELADAAELARIMMDGYIEWLEEEAFDHGIKPLKVEERFTALVGTFQGVEVYVSGAIDLLMQDEDSLVYVYDHKTLDTFKTILSTLPVDFQGQTYDFLVRSCTDLVPTSFIHNQLRRVKRTANAKPPFYNRSVVHFNDVQRRRHEWHMQGIAADIVGRILAIETIPQADLTRALHFYFPPHYNKDSSWMSNFLDVSILMDTDPEAAEEMIEANYKQKEKVA